MFDCLAIVLYFKPSPLEMRNVHEVEMGGAVQEILSSGTGYHNTF